MTATLEADTLKRQTLILNAVSEDFYIVPVRGDGACLFNMLSLALFGTERFSIDIRQDIVKHIVANYNYYGDFITDIRTGTNIPKQMYENQMLQPFTFGTYVEIVAASALFCRRIMVFREGSLECDIGNNAWDCIVTIFSGNRDAGHYDLAWPTKRQFKKPPHQYRAPETATTLPKEPAHLTLIPAKKMSPHTPTTNSISQVQAELEIANGDVIAVTGRPMKKRRGRQKTGGPKTSAENKRYKRLQETEDGRNIRLRKDREGKSKKRMRGSGNSIGINLEKNINENFNRSEITQEIKQARKMSNAY